MTVSRRVEITYDCPDNEAAEKIDSRVMHFLHAHSDLYGITDIAFSSEPVIPSPEPLVEPG